MKIWVIKRLLKRNWKTVILMVIFSYIIIKYVLKDLSVKLELFNEYVEIDILSKFRQIDDHSERFIMYRCDQQKDKHDCGGLGDRFKGILAAYLWSILDNRTLIVQINRPCNFVNLLEPNEIKWDKKVEISWFQTGKIDKRESDDFKERLKKIEFTKLKQSKSLIILQTNRNYFETVAKNPFYIDKLRSLGFDPDRFDLAYTFRLVYNRLFKLPPRLKQRFDEFLMKAKPTADTKLFCAQVRIGGSEHARFHNLDFKFQPVSNSKRYRDLIDEIFLANQTLKGSNFNIFLTTDNEQVYKDFKSHYGYNLVHIDGPFNHIDYIPYSANLNDCSMSEKSVLDFHVLAECDGAVISESQFGRMGILRRRERPEKDLYAYNKELGRLVKIDHLSQLRFR